MQPRWENMLLQKAEDKEPPFHIKISSWEFHPFSFYIWLKYFPHTWQVAFCLSLCSESFSAPKFKSQRLVNLHYSPKSTFPILKILSLFAWSQKENKTQVNEWTELRYTRIVSLLFRNRRFLHPVFLPEILCSVSEARKALGHHSAESGLQCKKTSPWIPSKASGDRNSKGGTPSRMV